MHSERALETKSVILVYGVILLACLFAEWVITGTALASWNESKPLNFSQIVAAILAVIVYLVVFRIFSRIFRWASDLEKLFRQVLTPFSYLQVGLLAILSGFAEEWLFRGLLFNYFGLFTSSIIFALAHLLPAPRVWLWSIWTFFAGLILGYFYRSSGSLLLVALMHTAINGVLLWQLNRTSHSSPALSSR